jgi:hypothetical protein
METILSHRVLLKHDEVMQASMASRSRPISVTWLMLLLIFGLAVAVETGHWFAFWFVQRLPFSVMFAIGPALPTATVVLFAFLVVVLVGSAQNWAIRRAYLRNFPKLGIPAEIDALFEILPEGLRLSTSRITILPAWQAIDRIERLELGWVFSADQLTFLIPGDSFADEASGRAFIAAAVERLTPEARGRSVDAVKFAEGTVGQ